MREWRRSGLKAEAFAARRRLKAGTLQWWAYKLKREESEAVKPLEFIEITRETVAPDQRFEVHLADGRRVVVPIGFDSEALARLISVVEAKR